MTSNTIHVNNISPNTPEDELRSFFSFCGKIVSLSMTPTSSDPDSSKSATITFERPSAAKTAVLLDGTPLNNRPLSVTPAASIDDLSSPPAVPSSESTEIRQEDKPRAAIFAEYLSQGYEIGDEILKRGIEFDQQHGLTARFSKYLSGLLHTLDEKTHVSDRAKQYHLQEKAEEAKGLLSRYFEKALGTGPGQKVRGFYESGEKQIWEIHAEAKRLAELRKEKKRLSQEVTGGGQGQTTTTTCACAGEKRSCQCEEGKCACAGCEKSAVREAQEKAGPAGQLQHAAEDIKSTAADATSAANA